MADDKRSPLALHPYQQRLVESNARFNWVCWSRQIGKSHAASLRRILRGIKRRRNQIFLSASELQSRELIATARKHVTALKFAAEYREFDIFDDAKFKALEISIPAAGMRIIGLPANPRTVRGFTGDVLLDEFSMHQRDREIWGAVFPTVLRGRGELDICSTPKGRQNVFYRLKGNEVFAHSTVTIHDAIEQGLDVDAEELRRGLNDDELWRQEFLCEFMDEATSFLTYAMIQECEDQTLPRELDVAALGECRGEVYIGIDIGRKHDLTVLWAFERVGAMLVSRGLIELRAMTFRDQYAIVSAAVGCRCVRRCCVDATGMGMMFAEQLVEQFGDYRVEAITFGQTIMAEMAGKLRIAMEDRNLRMPVDEKIRNDLHSVRRTTTTTGRVSFQAPRGESHADRFWAAALAVYGATDGGWQFHKDPIVIGRTLTKAVVRTMT